MNTSRRLSINRGLLVGARCCGAGFAAGTPGITALWHDRGLSKGDFYLLEILFAIALLVLEVATGRFADRFGKVRTMKLGFIALAVGALVYAEASSFGGFLVGEVVAALGIALISGTDEALMFQSGVALGQDKAHQRWWTLSVGASFVAAALFALVGAQLSESNLSAPFLFCAGFQVVGLVLCFGLVEAPKDVAAQAEQCGGTLREAVSAIVLSSSHIRWMAIAPGFVAGLNQTFLWMYPEYLAECGIQRGDSGYVFALFNLVAGASAIGLRGITDTRRSVLIFFTLIGVLASSTLGLVYVVGGLAWLIILPQQVVRSVTGALFSDTLNKAIPEAVRVTALSVRNALRVLLYVTVMVPWWLGVDELGRTALFCVNLAVLLMGASFLWVTAPRSLRAKG
jgi:MFS family permease